MSFDFKHISLEIWEIKKLHALIVPMEPQDQAGSKVTLQETPSWPTETRAPCSLDEVNGRVWKALMAKNVVAFRDCRQHLDLMGTFHHRQQKSQAYSYKEMNSAKAKRVWKQILSQSNFQMRAQSNLHHDCSR
nr:PREDICTED: D-amino acid oxidase activator [Equus przewalskii]